MYKLNRSYFRGTYSGDVNFWRIAFEKIHENLPNDILFVPCGGDQVDFFVNAQLCRKINRRFIVVLDSDKGATDYDSKLENKAQLIEKVQNLGGEVLILRKREIENYYSREAIQRLLGVNFQLPDEFQIEDYSDIKEEIKNHILANYQGNFKAKNNQDIFEAMTKKEWLASGVVVDETTDLEIIINKILE